jgi:hypothetical protein
MVDETQEYVLVSEQDGNIEMVLGSVDKRSALYEALEHLGYYIIKRDRE